MAIVIVETLSDSPLTPEEPTETDLRVLNCLTERHSTWRYSLLSSDRLRMLCTFEAPDAESVRESYRKGGGGFKRIWTAQVITPDDTQPQPNETILKVFEGTYPNGLTEEDWNEVNQQILPFYAEHEVEWVQSYVSLDRRQFVGELNVSDAEVIRETYRKFGISCDRVWSAMVVRP